MTIQDVMGCVRKGVDEAREAALEDGFGHPDLEIYLLKAAGAAIDEYMKRQTADELMRREELQRDRSL